MKDIEQLENYLLHGTKNHRYMKSPEAQRAHKTLIGLQSDDKTKVSAMEWLYDRYGKRLVADKKVMKAFESGNNLQGTLEKYLKPLNNSDRVTLERKLFR